MRRIRDDERPRVIQVLPADGWRAVFADENGTPWADPLVCWALVDFGDMPENEADYIGLVTHARQAMVGITSTMDGWVDSPEGGGNLLGYAPAGESLDPWNERAQEYAAARPKP